MASIRLTRLQGPDDLGIPDTLRHAWPITVTAVGTDMPSEIFVFHAGQANDPVVGDQFECIASVSQLDEIPKNTPVSSVTAAIPYYRLSRLELVCRSAEEADRVWNSILLEVQTLIANFNGTLNLQASETGVVTEDGYTKDV